MGFNSAFKGLRAGPSEQLSGTATYKWALRSHWNNRNCGTINFRFSTRDRISPKKFPQGTRPQNCSPARSQAENVQRISVSRGAKLLVWPWAPTCFGPALDVT